ncbi:MAG TPA: hypothetical protein VGU64_22845 [Terriglobales bacterium]|nr:hypothetical protein [Terriglobales bacterium]
MRPVQYAPHPAHQQLASSENRSQQRYDRQNRSDLDERIYFSLAHATRLPLQVGQSLGIAAIHVPVTWPQPWPAAPTRLTEPRLQLQRNAHAS